MKSNRSLWKRLIEHRFDASHGTAPFSVKLKDAEGWSPEDTARVIEEYRRFLYLVVARGVDAVPPAPIDKAWTMHLTFTRNYWDRLVADVLRRPLHRDATASDDQPRASGAYAAFDRAYREEFAEPPPRDIWTDPKAWTWSSWVGLLLVGGVIGGFASFGLMWLFSVLFGIPLGDSEVDTSLERAGAAMFMLCWTIGFFSPLWAWFLTRRSPRLKSSKRNRSGLTSLTIGTGNVSIQLGSGASRD